MRTLQLIIKEKYLAEIIRGTKTIETRDIRPSNARKYIIDEPGRDLQSKPYDTIQFYAGYRPDRKKALVEVLGSEIVLFTNEKGEYLEFEEKGEVYIEAIIEYKLGKIISHNY